jgi:hypothetical protein
MGDELKRVGNGIYYDSALGNAADAAKAFTQWRFRDEEYHALNDIGMFTNLHTDYH